MARFLPLLDPTSAEGVRAARRAGRAALRSARCLDDPGSAPALSFRRHAGRAFAEAARAVLGARALAGPRALRSMTREQYQEEQQRREERRAREGSYAPEQQDGGEQRRGGLAEGERGSARTEMLYAVLGIAALGALLFAALYVFGCGRF